jgi:DNA repair protein RecN (Recombination protein N)
MCITHQPAIAALNGIHYKIDKKNLKDSTITHTQKLNKKEKVYEIAHLMTGGKVTQTSIKSANELLSSYL